MHHKTPTWVIPMFEYAARVRRESTLSHKTRETIGIPCKSGFPAGRVRNVRLESLTHSKAQK